MKQSSRSEEVDRFWGGIYNTDILMSTRRLMTMKTMYIDGLLALVSSNGLLSG